MRESHDPLRVEETSLDNGLEVFRQAPPPAARSFSATFVSPTGWAYDEGRDGLAVMAASTGAAAAGRRDRVALARCLDGYGAVLTHHCDPESAEVTVWGPAEATFDVLDVLADVVLRPRFEADDVERVRRQLLERQLREATQPEIRAEQRLLSTIFPKDHPYGRSGTGTRASVRRLRRADLVRFHRDRLGAAGSLLVLTTREPLASVVRAARERFGGLPKGSAPAHLVPPRGPPAEREPVRIAMPGRTQVELRIGAASIARSDPAYSGAFLANEVLGGRALLSRLFQNVRERAGLAYHASSDLEAMRWGGYWQAEAGTGPERIESARKLVSSELRRIHDELVPARELDRIRESAIGELPLALETTQGAHDLAVDVAYHHLGERFLATWPTALRSLSPRDVRDAAQHAGIGAGAVTILAGPAHGGRAGSRPKTTR